ncbi:hypothetical protein BRC96_10200 [Halobacteriales archaeon QS_6_64_34]|nr:MAG: hypothetical protein BRC96_10200 [Halobacteriales archaeon QS_6_64_34]
MAHHRDFRVGVHHRREVVGTEFGVATGRDGGSDFPLLVGDVGQIRAARPGPDDNEVRFERTV